MTRVVLVALAEVLSDDADVRQNTRGGAVVTQFLVDGDHRHLRVERRGAEASGLAIEVTRHEEAVSEHVSHHTSTRLVIFHDLHAVLAIAVLVVALAHRELIEEIRAVRLRFHLPCRRLGVVVEVLRDEVYLAGLLGVVGRTERQHCRLGVASALHLDNHAVLVVALQPYGVIVLIDRGGAGLADYLHMVAVVAPAERVSGMVGIFTFLGGIDLVFFAFIAGGKNRRIEAEATVPFELEIAGCRAAFFLKRIIGVSAFRYGCVAVANRLELYIFGRNVVGDCDRPFSRFEIIAGLSAVIGSCRCIVFDERVRNRAIEILAVLVVLLGVHTEHHIDRTGIFDIERAALLDKRAVCPGAFGLGVIIECRRKLGERNAGHVAVLVDGNGNLSLAGRGVPDELPAVGGRDVEVLRRAFNHHVALARRTENLACRAEHDAVSVLQ